MTKETGKPSARNDYFAELRDFLNYGGACRLSSTAGMLYLAGILPTANEQHWPEWVELPSDLLKARSGIGDRVTMWRARRELEDVGFIADGSRQGSRMIRFTILGAKHAASCINNETTTDATANTNVSKDVAKTKQDLKRSSLRSSLRSQNDAPVSPSPATDHKPSRARTELNCTNTESSLRSDSPASTRVDARVADTPKLFLIDEPPKKNGDGKKPNPADGFEEFWEAYPKKVGKKPALQMWTRAAKTRPPIERILNAVARQSESDQWLRGFIPHAATWLNQERWDDDPAALVGGRNDRNEEVDEREEIGQIY